MQVTLPNVVSAVKEIKCAVMKGVSNTGRRIFNYLIQKILLRQFERLRMLNLDPGFLSQPSFGLPALPPSSTE